MYWFVIGAVFGIIHVWWWLSRKNAEILKPIPTVLIAAVMGAATYGTILWLFFGGAL